MMGSRIWAQDRPWIEVGFTLALLAMGTWLGERISVSPGVIVPPSEEAAKRAEEGKLTPAQKEALAVVRELEKLLLSLTGLLIGGVVAIVAKDGIVRPSPPRFARLLLIATFMAAAYSIYFGYFAYMRILEMLERGFFSAAAKQLWEPLTWQYRLFLFALAGMAAFVMLAWFDKQKNSVSLEEKPVSQAATAPQEEPVRQDEKGNL